MICPAQTLAGEWALLRPSAYLHDFVPLAHACTTFVIMCASPVLRCAPSFCTSFCTLLRPFGAPRRMVALRAASLLRPHLQQQHQPAAAIAPLKRRFGRTPRLLALILFLISFSFNKSAVCRP